MILRITLFFFSIVSLSCINKKKDTEKETSKCFSYPVIIDSLHFEHFYDSARWYIYTWNCDKKFIPRKQNGSIKTFGELDLRFNKLTITNDTMKILFNFYNGAEMVYPGNTKDNVLFASGVLFDLRKKTKIDLVGFEGYSFNEVGGSNRYENPLNGEVIAYFNKHTNINPCFIALYKKIVH
jgi:hypothetical protein